MGTFAVNRDDFDHASRLPATGLAAFEALFGLHGPDPHLERKIFDGEDSRNLPHTLSFFRQQGVGPISAALVATGAASAPQHEFGMTGERGELGRPVVHSHSAARK